MINWFQKRLAKGVVVVCLSEIGEKAIPLRFVKLTQKKDFSKLARADDIYVLEKRSITKYYYYSEPGNPFLSEKYHCLADFVLEILASKIRNRVLMAAMQLSYFPEKCEFPELKAYLEKNNFGERTIDKIQLGMEIEKYLSQPIYHKVDKIMNQTAFGFVNWLIFGRDSIKNRDILCL